MIYDPLPADLPIAALDAAFPEEDAFTRATFGLAACGWQPLYSFGVWKRPMSTRGGWFLWADGTDPGGQLLQWE